MPTASASLSARPQKNSIWLSMRALVWLVIITPATPSSLATSRLPGPPSITTRSQGTSTSSKTAMQSISPKRVVKAVGRRWRYRLATEELQTRRVVLDRETHRVGVVTLSHTTAPGETDQLLRY